MPILNLCRSLVSRILGHEDSALVLTTAPINPSLREMSTPRVALISTFERGQNGLSNLGCDRNVVGPSQVDLISRPPGYAASQNTQILFNAGANPKPRRCFHLLWR